MVSVILPTQEMHDSIGAELGGASVTIWRPDSDAAFPGPTDLLVLPYLMPWHWLADLEGLPIANIQGHSLGYDGVAEYLPEGMTFCNMTDVYEAPTAELAVALVLAAQRGIAGAVRNGDRSTWVHEHQPGLAGKRVLLVGAGGVGRATAARLDSFEVETRFVASRAREGVFGPEDLATQLAWADIVVIGVPLSNQTHHLVDAEFLSHMRDGALLVNVARGPVVDTDALLAELQSGRLRAALDVTDPEPLPSGHPLWSVPNTLITPHNGGDTDAAATSFERFVVRQVQRLLADKPLENVVLGPELDLLTASPRK